MIAQGLVAPHLHYRGRASGTALTAAFGFALVADLTRHPYRLQCGQYKLTRILADALAALPPARSLRRPRHGLRRPRRPHPRHPGARRDPRRLLADRRRRRPQRRPPLRRHRLPGLHLAGALPRPLHPLPVRDADPGLAEVSYFAGPEEWFFLLRVPGPLWRAMFPIAPEIPEGENASDAFAQARMAGIVPGRGGYGIRHRALYRVHQRVAETFRKSRVLLVGDAAHINNPLGGMGLNGSVHAAVNLADKLARIWHGEAPDTELDRHDRQRRTVCIEHVQARTIRNKEHLEARDPAARRAFQDRLRATAADPAKARDYLIGASMIASLRRAEEIA